MYKDNLFIISIMEKIGIKHNTDKITQHGYHRFYPQFIDFIKTMENIGILEIGMDRMYSLNMWLEYFPKVFIYGADIGYEDIGDRHKIIKCDQSNLINLISLKNNLSHKIYFINDDGSHIPEHQIISFNYLFEHVLENDGIYIIEDIETSYWTKNGLYGYKTNYGYKHNKSVVEIFKNLIDYVNKEFLNQENKEQLEKILLSYNFNLSTIQKISSITFCQNCIIIKKTNEQDYNYQNRNYRFLNNL